jgi:hypothetical protein
VSVGPVPQRFVVEVAYLLSDADVLVGYLTAIGIRTTCLEADRTFDLAGHDA